MELTVGPSRDHQWMHKRTHHKRTHPKRTYYVSYSIERDVKEHASDYRDKVTHDPGLKLVGFGLVSVAVW